MNNAVQNSRPVNSETLRPTGGAATRIGRNFLFLGVGRVGNMLLSFLVVTWLARKLRPEGFGLISFALALLSYFIVLAQGGLQLLGVREVAREPRRALHYVGRIQGLQILQSVFAFLLMLVVTFLAPRSRLEKEILLVFGITLLLYPFQLDWVLQGIERMGLLAAITFIQGAVYVSLVIWKVRGSEAVIWVPVAFLVGTVVQDALLTTSVFRRFGSCLPSFNLSVMRTILGTSLPMGFSMAMVTVYWNTGSVVLGLLKGNAFVGWYNAAIKIVLVLVIVPQLYNQAMVPSISALFTQSLPKLERLVNESIRLMAFLAVPMMLGGIILSRKIILVLYGVRYTEAVVALQILFVGVAIIYVYIPLGSTVLYCGRERLYMWAVTLGALVNVVVNLISVPWLGITGAAIACILCESVVSTLMYLSANRVVPVRLLPSLWRPVLCCFPMALVLILTRSLALGWQVLFGGASYVVAMMLLGGLKGEDLAVAKSLFRSRLSPAASRFTS
jgi:O-antigen/teichoic acid export membrane protein